MVHVFSSSLCASFDKGAMGLVLGIAFIGGGGSGSLLTGSGLPLVDDDGPILVGSASVGGASVDGRELPAELSVEDEADRSVGPSPAGMFVGDTASSSLGGKYP